VEMEEGTSAAAVGLAMKPLLPNETNLRINMLPPEAADVKSLKRHALITANILAAILFIMIIAIAGLGLRAKNLKAEIERKKNEPLLSDLKALVREEKIIDSRIKQLSGEPGRLNEILGSREDVDWPALLNDIRKGTPKTVCITSIFNKGNTALNVEGVGLSYEAIRWFVNMLGESKHIVTASLTETEKDDEKGGLIRYSISCLWANEERK
jgi:Tfp pilus assembly protein PilN